MHFQHERLSFRVVVIAPHCNAIGGGLQQLCGSASMCAFWLQDNCCCHHRVFALAFASVCRPAHCLPCLLRGRLSNMPRRSAKGT